MHSSPSVTSSVVTLLCALNLGRCDSTRSPDVDSSAMLHDIGVVLTITAIHLKILNVIVVFGTCIFLTP